MEKLDISQPTLYRAVKAQPETVIALGGRRNRKVAALRSVRELGSSLPVFTVNPDGEVTPVGRLLSFHPSSFGFVLDHAPTTPRYFSGLPAFLSDARPQGFLGDAFARRHSDLALPPRSSAWSNDDILQAMARRGEDLPGNVLLGEESYARFQARQTLQAPVVAEASLSDFYRSSAAAASEGILDGAPVGGQQPKFTAIVENERGRPKPVVVKFSPDGDTFAARRWRDLLVCEWLALETLRDAGLPAADGRILEAGGRIFLETERFDRVGSHGRRRTMSAAALGAVTIGKRETWASLAGQLEHEGKITREDFAHVRVAECFGRMIANNDRNADNLTFLMSPGDPRAVLAPFYDMLPMQFAPGPAGGDGDGAYAPPLRESTLLDVWDEALEHARAYWERVLEDARISNGFKEIAKHALKALG